jgi:hypothetical protein
MCKAGERERRCRGRDECEEIVGCEEGLIGGSLAMIVSRVPLYVRITHQSESLLAIFVEYDSKPL